MSRGWGAEDQGLHVGARVDVWNKFLGRWSGPFEVVGISPDGCQVRRPGDRDPLPETFLPAEVSTIGIPRRWA